MICYSKPKRLSRRYRKSGAIVKHVTNILCERLQHCLPDNYAPCADIKQVPSGKQLAGGMASNRQFNFAGEYPRAIIGDLKQPPLGIHYLDRHLIGARIQRVVSEFAIDEVIASGIYVWRDVVSSLITDRFLTISTQLPCNVRLSQH